jgi:hypothetical protein
MAKQQFIRITGCTDGMRWYADHVGEEFPLLAAFSDEYKTREPAGYTNFVLLKDAEIVTR